MSTALIIGDTVPCDRARNGCTRAAAMSNVLPGVMRRFCADCQVCLECGAEDGDFGHHSGCLGVE